MNPGKETNQIWPGNEADVVAMATSLDKACFDLDCLDILREMGGGLRK
jgi:hypothetical protein